MAMIDYGAIVFKNGKLMTHDMFTPMKEAVGWEDDESMVTTYGNEPLHLNGMYFAYIGDKEHTLAFYKEQMTEVCCLEDDEDIFISKDTEFFNNRYTWSRWKTIIGTEYCTVRPRNGYYVLHWKYKGDKYKVYFGYGVDIDSYKKWRIVNYYRSIPYYFNKIKNRLRRKGTKWKTSKQQRQVLDSAQP